AIGIGAVYYVMVLNKIQAFLYNPEAFILVYGGTIGSVLISYPWEIIKQALGAMRLVLFPRRRMPKAEVISMMVSLAEQAKRGGVRSLQKSIESLPSGQGFLQDGLQMVVDGLDRDILQTNLEKSLVFINKRHDEVAGVYRLCGVYAPIFGLLGTLIGVVQVLRHLTDPGKLGTYMAIAVTATFYGIFGANFFFLPIASKLSAQSGDELLVKEVMVEGILSIQQGDIPLIVEKKLHAYLAHRMRQQAAEA
ncbi:MAG: MotA/TolQ/ExbB proton channel family protein, partial [bacterium]